MNNMIQLKLRFRTLIAVELLIACVGLTQLVPKAFGVVPAPDGAYPGGNTAEGQKALQSLTTGGFNTGIGYFSLFANTTGFFNTAVGAGALDLNTASNNTAIGAAALLLNTTGDSNTSTGVDALVLNTAGSENSAFGVFALGSNTVGSSNTAVGFNALSSTTAGFNTGVGRNALVDNTTGAGNTALGDFAGSDLTTGDDNIDIGSSGVAGDSGTIRIGSPFLITRTFIAGIRGKTTGNNNAVPVLIDSDGQLGTVSSSRRFKKEIKPMDKASEAILALKPVTFHYKTDNKNTPQFGLIAEEVAEVNPDLVVRDENGEIYTVRYDAVNAMLLSEFLKEHRKVEAQDRRLGGQEATITELKSTIARQQEAMEVVTAQLKEQAAQIQKVSAQFEVSKAGSQVVINKP